MNEIGCPFDPPLAAGNVETGEVTVFIRPKT